MVTENNRYYDTELLNGDNVLIEKIISQPYKGELESLPVKIFDKSGESITETFENFTYFYRCKIKKSWHCMNNKMLLPNLFSKLLKLKNKNSHIRRQRTNIIEAYLREDFEIRNKAQLIE